MLRQDLLVFGVALALAALGVFLVLTRSHEPADDRVHIVFEAGVAIHSKQWLEDCVARFNASQDRITVHPRIGPPMRYPDKLKAEFATGTIGDVVEIHVLSLAAIADAGAFLDLGPYIRDPRFAALDTRDFYDSALSSAQYRGVQYALPIQNSAMCVFYNKDLFDAAGVPYPTDDWTWEDWEAAWARLFFKSGRPVGRDDAPDVYPTLIFPNVTLMLPAIWSAGGELLDDEQGKCLLDTPASIEGARFYLERMAAFAPDAAAAREMTHQQTAFIGGKVATMLDGPWGVSLFAANAPFRWDAAMMPRPPGKPSLSRYTGLTVGIAANCPHPAEAFEFICFMLNTESQVELVRGGTDLSPRRSVGRMEVTLNPETPWDESVFVRSIEQSRLPPQVPYLGRVLQETTNTMEQVMLYGHDIADAMRKVSARIDAIIAEHRARSAAEASGGVPIFSAVLLLLGGLAGCSLLGVLLGRGGEGRRRRRGVLRAWRSYLFIAPNLAGFAAFSLVPMVAGLLISFTQWDIIGTPQWVGLRNYIELFELDGPWEGFAAWWQRFCDGFGYSIFNTLFMMAIIPISMLGSLLLAVLLNRSLALHRFYRLSFFLPSVTVGVGIFYLWELLLQKEGLVNTAIAATGSVSAYNYLCGTDLELVNWFHGSTWTSKPAIMLVTFWASVGGRNMILYLAGLAGIAPELYEAARIDGAGWYVTFRRITIPMLLPTTFFIFVTSLISGIQGGTDIGILITSGGPDRSTTSMGLDLYFHGWTFAEMGKAAAIGYVMFAIVFVMTALAWRWGKQHGGTDVV